MKYLFTLLLGVSVLMSCSDSTRIMSEETSMANLYFITQDSAIILANKAVASISGISCDATRGIKTTYGKDESVSNSDNIASTFIKMGYYSPSRFTKMSNLSTICSILDKAKDGTTSNSGDGPLLVAARCLSGGAHVWVVDGYAKNPVSKNDGSVFNHIYLHCVWGNKNGVNNGYFYINDKGRVGGKASLYDLEDTGGNDVAEVYWYDGLYYMSNFRKNTNNALGNVEI